MAGRMTDWISWALNDAGLLSTWHALAPGRASALCGRRVPVERIHKCWRLFAVSDLGRRDRVCRARAMRRGVRDAEGDRPIGLRRGRPDRRRG